MNGEAATDNSLSTCEPVFSLLNNSFNAHQDSILQDYIETRQSQTSQLTPFGSVTHYFIFTHTLSPSNVYFTLFSQETDICTHIKAIFYLINKNATPMQVGVWDHTLITLNSEST